MSKEPLSEELIHPEAEVSAVEEQQKPVAENPKEAEDSVVEVDLKGVARDRNLDATRRRETITLPEHVLERQNKKSAIKRHRHNAAAIGSERKRKERKAKSTIYFN